MRGRLKLEQVLAGNTVTPPPVWLMRQAGRYLPEYRAVRERAGSFLDLCFSPELAAEVTLQPVWRFDVDAAIVFADILLVPWALGLGVDFVEGEGPVIEPRTGPGDVGSLKVEEAAEALAAVYATIGKVRAGLSAEKAVIGFCGGPWTVATYMAAGGPSADHLEARLWAYRNPESFAVLIDCLVRVSAEYLVRQIHAGASCVMIFDSWASVLAAGAFERWVVEPTRMLVELVRAKVPGARIIGFPRGAGIGYERFVGRTGVDAVGIDPAVPLDWARERLQSRVAVQGNVDPAALLVGGSALEDAVRQVLVGLGAGPLIVNLGHGVHKETPPEHVAEMVAHVRAGSGR